MSTAPESRTRPVALANLPGPLRMLLVPAVGRSPTMWVTSGDPPVVGATVVKPLTVSVPCGNRKTVVRSTAKLVPTGVMVPKQSPPVPMARSVRAS